MVCRHPSVAAVAGKLDFVVAAVAGMFDSVDAAVALVS